MSRAVNFLGSRVARRLFWLFVVAALLPLALSDWLATAAISELARDLQQRNQLRSTRQTGLQVFDRLITAKAMLAALPSAAGLGDQTPAAPLPAAGDRMFSQLMQVDTAGRVDWPPDASGGLGRAWELAAQGSTDPAPQALRPDAGSVAAALRILVDPADPAAPPRLLLATRREGGPNWLGELRPDFVWEPVVQSAIDSGWRVLDGSGRTLTRQGEPALLPSAAGAATASPDRLLARTSVFLGAEFGAADWTFVEQRATPQARWLGVSLAGWLGLVAAGTVLLIALISQRVIRRMLSPLEQLTAGTRSLSAGTSTARIAVSSDDEFGVLAKAFNEMASRIESQFESLAGLAAVDRQVLAGAPIESLVEQVLVQIGRLHPHAQAAVAWLAVEPQHGLTLACTTARGIELSRRSISPTQADRLGAISTDHVIAPDAADVALPWCDAVAAGGSLAVLPLRWGAGTRALLVLGFRPGQPADDLQSAAELRDRLAVAFSARDRERLMVHRAVHDGLTGLANRAGLGDFVDRMLAVQPAHSHAVLFVDLDHFKDANDSLGHETGDLILAEAGRRLRSCVDAGALVARQGGDEFVLVLPLADSGGARAVAQQVVDALGAPFELRGEQHRFGASVGIALHPSHGRDRTALLRHADLAMYAAKQAGRGRYELFDESLERAAHERLRIPRELRRDMDLGKLVAHFQARVDPLDGRVCSVEALVRWMHPERGLLMPDTFIALAEESALIEDLGSWMINEACSRMVHWRRLHPNLRRVSVNVSPRQLSSGQLPGQVRAALQRHGLPAQALELEVTESLLVEDSGASYAQLAELRAMGILIALDDFGTGFSSMAMLRKLPIDVMKIDRAFVKDLDRDDSALAITRSIAELAHSLGLHLVAEGIETAAQSALLSELGCNELQGYLFSRPLPPAEFSMLCSRRDALAAGSAAA